MLSLEFCLKPSRIPKRGTNFLTTGSAKLEVSCPFPEHTGSRAVSKEKAFRKGLELPGSGKLPGRERVGHGGNVLIPCLMKKHPLVYNEGVLKPTGSKTWGLNPAQGMCGAWRGQVPHASTTVTGVPHSGLLPEVTFCTERCAWCTWWDRR